MTIKKSLFDSVLASESKTRSTLYALIAAFFTVLVVGNVIVVFRARQVAYDGAETQNRGDAVLLSQVIHGRFENVRNLAISWSTRVRFRELIAEGKWSEAMAVLAEAQAAFPSVDRIFLADTKGILKADLPARPEVQNTDFSYRDWYKGVSKEWKPYVSEVYRRQATPQVEVVAFAVPISPVGGGNPMAILVLQVRADTLLDWGRHVEFGRDVVPYFVDRNGRIFGRPEYVSAERKSKLADRPFIARLLSGERGVETFHDADDDIIIAYAPVADFGWGTVIEQDRAAAVRPFYATYFAFGAFAATIIAVVVLMFLLLFGISRALHSRHRREAAILRNAGDGLAAIDTEWNIVLWNPAAARITGWSEEEVVGKNLRKFLRFVRLRDRSENVLFISDAMLSGEVRSMENHTYLIRKDGTEAPVSDSAAPILDEAGKAVGAIVIFRDATKEQEDSMIRSSFAYASHQLRTPVTAAVWNMQMAAEEIQEKEAKKKLDLALSSMRSVQKLVAELVEVSEIDQRIVLAHPESVRLAEIVGDAIGETSEVAARKAGVAVRTAMALPELRLSTDPHLLKRIIKELVENAVAYSHRDGEVRVSAETSDGHVIFEVADDGIGIPEEEQGIVFTKFFRGHNVPPGSVGAGLGLFICSRYAELLRGRIWFKSTEGKGTTFFLSVPV